MLGQHDIELELEVLELLVGDQTATAVALTPDEHAVLDLPARSGWCGCIRCSAARGSAPAPTPRGDRPAAEVLAVEERLPRARRLSAERRECARRRCNQK